MFAGSQSVHLLYRPLDDLPQFIEEFKEKQKVSESREGASSQ